jgi:HAD superfamily phosphoserine phosphatase-like hydrolase
MSRFKAVIFDIDGTLTNEESWTALAKEASGSFDDLHNRKKEYGKAKQRLLADWQEHGKTDRSHVIGLFDGWPLKAGAASIFEQLRMRETPVCLISGSIDLYVKSVAKQLGVKDYYFNAALHYKGNKLTEIEYDPDQVGLKLEQLNAYCQKRGFKLKDCAAVGDSSNDIELFRATGRGILVEGGGATDELRKAAWKTVDSLAEIPALLS